MEIVPHDIPQDELALFATLKDIKVVFDVGTRTDIEYLKIKPDIELHCFEPNPEFFEGLKAQIGTRGDTFLNNYALGDEEGEAGYERGRQSLVGSEANITRGEYTVPIKTLDWYCAENKIEQIDFLKIDTEGFDYKVLLGARETIPKCRFIQYEHWNNKLEFHDLLERDFIMSYIGYRNVFCTRK